MAHSHAPTAAGRNERRLAVVFGLTAFYLVVEVVGGLLTDSLALLADAGHMLTDVAGTGLALLAVRFARRPATPERTYGFYRAEILAALANAVVLVGCRCTSCTRRTGGSATRPGWRAGPCSSSPPSGSG